MHKRKIKFGEVVRDRMNKSRIVEISTLVMNPRYGKRVKKRKRIMAHDERGQTRIGDYVKIVETRPLSKRKTWKIVKVINPKQEG